MTDSHIALPARMLLNDYFIIRMLGKGGFGITYLAYDIEREREVAIKEYMPDCAMRKNGVTVLPKSAGEDTELFNWGGHAFLNEARTLKKFGHDQIVRIHDQFEANGTAYIVMEYAKGETLLRRIEREGRLDESTITSILLALIDGLKQIHAEGFLHRDIKPANIVIREGASPVLIDFGSARQLVGSKSLPLTSLITPGYAPIEQYSTKETPGPWSDIYALGATAYHMLSGEQPEQAIDRLRDDPLQAALKSAAGYASPKLLNALDAGLGVFREQRPESVEAWEKMFVGDLAEPLRARGKEPARRVNIETIHLGRKEKIPANTGRRRADTSKKSGLEPETVLIEPGEFLMGSPGKEGDREERPQHAVRITKPFYLAKYPTTVGEFRRFAEAPENKDVSVNKKRFFRWLSSKNWRNPGFAQTDDHPVVYVSWADVQEYIEWLNWETDRTYRLPTEAEWEYAARAGTTTPYSFGDDESQLNDYAWHKGNAAGKTHRVGGKKPNPWGLHDMHGNVWEWVQDCWHGNYQGAPEAGEAWSIGFCNRRVVRGGSWGSGPWRLRSASRSWSTPDARSGNLGFRLSRM